MKWSDGTPYNPPENPLKEKWAKLYPPCDLSDHGDFDYSCILCSNCPNSEYWQVPEEDKEVWEQHRLAVKKYVEDHGGLGELLLELNINYNLAAINEGETKSERNNL